MEIDSPFSVSMGRALWVMAMVTGPPLLIMGLVGLVISIIQAATSVNEQTVSFVPKLLALLFVLAVFGAAMRGLLIDDTRDLLIHIPDEIQ